MREAKIRKSNRTPSAKRTLWLVKKGREGPANTPVSRSLNRLVRSRTCRVRPILRLPSLYGVRPLL